MPQNATPSVLKIMPRIAIICFRQWYTSNTLKLSRQGIKRVKVNYRHFPRYPGYTVQFLLFNLLLEAATKLKSLDIRCLASKLLYLDVVEFPSLAQLRSSFLSKLSMGQNTLVSLFKHSKSLREGRDFRALLRQGTITRLTTRSNSYSSFGTSANLRPDTIIHGFPSIQHINLT